MNINEAFPSKYLKADDLQGREVTVSIDHVAMEKVGDDNKMALYFRGKQKGIILNKTNAMNIATAYGTDTNNWIGNPVILFPAWVDFQGKSVQAIRVRPGMAGGVATGGQQMRQPQPMPQQPQGGNGNGHADLDDDIPFN